MHHKKQLAVWKKRRQRIVIMRDEKELSFTAIGEKLGISRQQAFNLYRTEVEK